MQSLRDKLLKAGLVSEDAAKKAEEEKKAAPRAPRPPPRRDAPPDESRIPKLPPLAGSKEANRQMARAQLELDRTIRERVSGAQVPVEPGPITFYFVTRKNKLRRLELTPEQAKRLETGELAVVERPDPDKIDHALVPAEVAEGLLALSQKAVRFLNKAGSPVGFLSEEEIHQRATEAETKDDEPAPSAHAPPDEPATGGPFITIKRAPLTES